MSVAPIADQPNSRRDLGFAIAVTAILTIFFIPVPPILIDLGLAISIALSIVILLVALWIDRPTDFSAFPTILLIATTLRLALNIATTRLILADGAQGHAAAGHVIAGFSQLVMRGDFVIGIIVFIIVVTVNFVVITKGATRIAEVGARFTLDSIPGKQMAIDADLAAGLIDDQGAQLRRTELEAETAFFGAMDGASKFVRGDAIAGIVILLVNSIGGMTLGLLRHNMSAAQAADVFTRLSIGDGLVTQIPALIVALAAGLLVSKGGTRGSADRAVLDQLGRHPRALWVASGILVALSLAPGLPMLPFAALAGVCALIAHRTTQDLELAGARDTSAASRRTAVANAGEGARPGHAPLIEIQCGKQLAVHLLGPRSDMIRRIGRIRKRFAEQYGFVIPEIRVVEEFRLPDRQYRIFIQSAIVAQYDMRLGEVMVVVGDGGKPDLHGEDAAEPAFGLAALWFPEGFTTELRRQGFEAVNTESIVLTHLTETIRSNLGTLFSYRDLRGVLDSLDSEYRRLLDDISPSVITSSGLLALMKSLLGERISIRNMQSILEAVAEIAPHSRKIEPLVEGVRLRLAPQICYDFSDDGSLRVMRLGPRWDGVFSEALKRDAKGEIVEFALDPKHIEDFVREAAPRIGSAAKAGAPFALVATAEARPFVRMLTERLNPAVPVLSHLEVVRYRSVETIESLS